MPTCALFWGVSLVLIFGGWPSEISQYLLALGVLSNAAVTLANGGFMPVALRTPSYDRPVRSLWVQRRSGQRLLFLADNFGTRYFRFSIGDVLLLAGIVLSFFAL